MTCWEFRGSLKLEWGRFWTELLKPGYEVGIAELGLWSGGCSKGRWVLQDKQPQEICALR